jgi:protein required for attachment to host cells
MADSREDILAKANMLLRRHASPRPAADESADVPVLTDLVAPGGALAGRAYDDLAGELVAEVIRAVQSRLAEDLERRVTQHLVAEVQSAVASTLGDLRQDIANAVGDAVAEALARRPRK